MAPGEGRVADAGPGPRTKPIATRIGSLTTDTKTPPPDFGSARPFEFSRVHATKLKQPHISVFSENLEGIKRGACLHEKVGRLKKKINVNLNPACGPGPPPQSPRSRARYPPGLPRRGRIRNEKRTRVRIAVRLTDPRLSPRPYTSACQRSSQRTSVQPPCAIPTTTYPKRGSSPRTPGWSGL